MKIDLRSVGCSLRTACLCIAGYTLLLGFALLGFTIYDYTHAPDYFLWLQISSFNWSFGLWLAAGCLFTGLVRQSRKLVRGWLLLFALYVGFQIAALSWNIYHYFEFTELVPQSIYLSMKIYITLFSILVFADIACLVTVIRYRETHLRP
ncbi:hypothetical protein RvY_15170-2 [Ramazzottius varieornatus]|uniref:Uncharacterized protein n=1 Tax=Ramazzottius varieornatus TaxID=947166 RepID=A0A1D1VXF0_RAMVA|nr:hypothetical protein RvY_15170-2 [Ramazzottius varieornatus]